MGGRWSIANSWHWVRDVPQKEDAHRYREFNGVQILATLRSLAINALRLDGIWSITEGIAALAHEIKGLLTLLGWTEPATATPSGGLLIGPGMSALLPAVSASQQRTTEVPLGSRMLKRLVESSGSRRG